MGARTNETTSSWLKTIETTLDEVLPSLDEKPSELAQAMRYAVGTGGKRVRPLICLGSAVAVGGNADDARYPASAIEILHNYTLVHDDLPAMDGDEMRRGAPSVWKRFGEANAILAGDALLTLAFRVAALAPRRVQQIVATLASHGVGVVRGQVADVAHDGNADFVYLHKTADLFMAAAEMGALSVGATDADVEKVRLFAENLGLAFQYQDDLIDGDGAFSRDETVRLADSATIRACAALEGLSGDAGPLLELAKKLTGRTF